jgi:hypothetical protein
MGKKKRRQYTEEFRRQAVSSRLYRDQGNQLAKLLIL